MTLEETLATSFSLAKYTNIIPKTGLIIDLANVITTNNRYLNSNLCFTAQNCNYGPTNNSAIIKKRKTGDNPKNSLQVLGAMIYIIK